MPKITYVPRNFNRTRLWLLGKAEEILNQYAQDGFALTVRQLYYQFVARDLLPNTQVSYNRLGSAINKGRLAGYIDWNLIVDRTRNLRSLSHWDSPEDIIDSVSQQFRVNLWEDQSHYIEVWIEKDALIGVIEGICEELDVPYFSCRGYVSQSELWRGAQRFIEAESSGKKTILFHLGDHDPSGINMTDDIQNRMYIFESEVDVVRLGLSMEQINRLQPPPNPAKETDSRFEAYRRQYGESSWELDALPPQEIINLIQEAVEAIIEPEAWSESHTRTNEGRADLTRIVNRWDDVQEFIEEESE